MFRFCNKFHLFALFCAWSASLTDGLTLEEQLQQLQENYVRHFNLIEHLGLI